MTAAEPGPSLVGRFAEKLQPMLGHIEALVTCESPSADLAAVARSADLVATPGAALLPAAPSVVVLLALTSSLMRSGVRAPRPRVLPAR